MTRIVVVAVLLTTCMGVLAADETSDRFSEGWYAYQDSDYDRALHLWLPLAEAGDVDTQYYIGELYRDGLGDPATALGWFEKAATQGFVKAQNDLGRAYLNGEGVARDDAVAFRWYHESAIDADIVGQSTLGWMYETGRGTAADIAKALSWYRLAAKQGSVGSLNALGRIYAEGKDVGADMPMSCYWYGQAAEQGDGFAKYRLGYCYARGWGREVDDGLAIDLFRQAIHRDIAEALQPLEWYAGEDHATAQYTLAQLFSEGGLVERDDDRAFSMARAAADQGHIGSLALLGSFYFEGKGVRQDEGQAEELLLKAALANSGDAKPWLAQLYASRADSNPANLSKAFVWSNLAVLHDSSDPGADPGDAVVEMMLGFMDGASMEMISIQMEAEASLGEDRLKVAEALVETWDRLYGGGLPGVTTEHLRSLNPPDG